MMWFVTPEFLVVWFQPSRFPPRFPRGARFSAAGPFPPWNGPSSPTATGRGSAAGDFWGNASGTDLTDAWRRLRTELHSALGDADSTVSMVETVGTGMLDIASLQVGFVDIISVMAFSSDAFSEGG